MILLASGVLSIPFVCFGYDINDPDLPIGDPEYQIYGMDMSQGGSVLTLEIYTDSPENGHTIVSKGFDPDWTTFPGDLAIDLYDDFGNYPVPYEYGVAMTSHDGFQQGHLYHVTGWTLSDAYNPAYTPPPVPFDYDPGKIVTIQLADQDLGLIDSGPTWTEIASLGSHGLQSYRVQVTLDVADFLPPGFAGIVTFRWPSGTCANDIVKGSPTLAAVPEPATVLLFGSGLACLARVGRMRLFAT
ncbi:MAG: PEP-CTERM sorting domain-containing protein [Thermodesulfobacteriota bacterium]|nr:PEP-CTERM sorting domain-containing protein [Thermodesulfobacteriota bacterium]